VAGREGRINAVYHVVLDTSTLKRDPQRRTSEFRLLEELIREKHVRVHLPSIVVEELVSGLAADYRRQINGALDALRGVRRDFLESDGKNPIATLRDLAEAAEEKWRADVSAWMKRNDISVHNVPLEAAAAAINRYFSGMAPFRAPKNRNDFPDAFIWETVTALVERFGKLEFISGDTGFSAAAEALKKVRRHESLADFTSTAVSELNARLFDRLLELALDDTWLERPVYTELPSLLIGKDIAIAGFKDSTAEVEDASDPYAIEVNGSAARRIDKFRVLVPFSADIDVLTTETRPLATAEEILPPDWREDQEFVSDNGVELCRSRWINSTVAGVMDVEFIVPPSAGYVSKKALERILADIQCDLKDCRFVKATLEELELFSDAE
jgi:rRNA-processing protein FCF1